MKTAATVSTLKQKGQDFEWYPTTEAMIQIIRRHMLTKGYESSNDDGKTVANILDCGAGDGRVLAGLTDHGDKYAIEKSTVLLGQQPEDVIPVGTDFHQATLIDKKVDIVFSNPPYSEYEQWTAKIIREANAPDVYLIIPERWTGSALINAALERRKAEAKVIHSGDFLDADRAARAKINIIHVDLCKKYGNRKNHRYHCGASGPESDPFAIWFNDTFPKQESDPAAVRTKEKLKEAVNQDLVAGRNMIESLVELYNHDMGKLAKNYQAACMLDPEVMKELEGLLEGRNSLVATLRGALKQRISGLKHLYWHELFSNYASITDRLTTGSRKSILDTLHSNVNVDFTADNAYAITIWVIRNANKYYDSQLIDLVETMTEKANVKLYKSNKRVFKNEDWRYKCYWQDNKPDSLTHYQLDYRIVLARSGGIYTGAYGQWENPCNLDSRAHDLISDVVAVAKTLGWTTNDTSKARGHFGRNWKSNKVEQFVCNNGETLMEVRAFKNGNLHIKFNQKFIGRLNIEFGRLQGWVKDHAQASQEMDIPEAEARECFNSLQLIGSGSTALLLGYKNADAFDEAAAAELAKSEASEPEEPEQEKSEPVTFDLSANDDHHQPELQLALI